MTVHIFPINDWIDHDTESLNCRCKPDVQYINPTTGLPFDKPLVIHHALDQRDVNLTDPVWGIDDTDDVVP